MLRFLRGTPKLLPHPLILSGPEKQLAMSHQGITNLGYYNDAGMRCVGVTTSLSEADMAAQGPDAMRPQIGEIRLEDLLALEYAHEERRASGGRASSSGGGDAAVRPLT